MGSTPNETVNGKEKESDLIRFFRLFGQKDSHASEDEVVEEVVAKTDASWVVSDDRREVEDTTPSQ